LLVVLPEVINSQRLRATKVGDTPYKRQTDKCGKAEGKQESWLLSQTPGTYPGWCVWYVWAALFVRITWLDNHLKKILGFEV